jgi:hypothetical protein
VRAFGISIKNACSAINCAGLSYLGAVSPTRPHLLVGSETLVGWLVTYVIEYAQFSLALIAVNPYHRWTKIGQKSRNRECAHWQLAQ